MAWSLEQVTVFDWNWSVANSAFGAIVGTANSRNAAIVEMVIAELDLFEDPLPGMTQAMMRDDPDAWVEKYGSELASVVSAESTTVS